jgi:hypothetical protein
MHHPDDVARLREIKRLLDRIQQLPNIVDIPPNGLVGMPPSGVAGASLSGLGVPARNGLAGAPPAGPPKAASSNGLHAGPPALPASMREPEPPSLDDAVMPPIDLPRTVRADQSRALVPVQQRAAAGINPWVFVVATGVNTLIAAVLAVVITLGVVRRDPAPAEPEKVAALARPAPEPQAEPPVLRPVELFPIGSPAEPLRLEALKPARLPLQVRPEEAAEDSYILLLTGLPKKAALSGVSRMGADSWLVPPGALQHIEILVPEWTPAVVEVGVELRRTNGAVVAQSKLWLAIPPPPQPAGPSLDEEAINDLVRSGDRLLGRGDVAAARALYERAAVMGSAQAALALGSTYDERQLWVLGVFGMTGNKDRARHWYQRADELGHPEAKARIGALKER